MPASIAVSGITAQAFRLLEMRPISSFGDDSEEGVAATDQYPAALDICLERCDWSFASKVVTLPAASEASADPDLPYVYNRPADMVRVQRIWPDAIAWRLDHDRLRADDKGPLALRYTMRITDETRLGAQFRTAVAYRLASLLAPRWITSLNRAGELAQMSERYLDQAAAADRRSASPARYDGMEREGDWAGVAVARGVTGLGR